MGRPAIIGGIMGALAVAVVALAVALIVVSRDEDEDQQAGGSAGDQTVFLYDVFSRQAAEPSSYAFSVNGDLEGTELQWRDWGGPTATATGTFRFNPAPHTGPSAAIPGTLSVGNPRQCKGAAYYTTVEFQFDETPPFEPRLPVLPTPCG